MSSFSRKRPNQLFLYPQPELLAHRGKNAYIPWWDALLSKDYDLVEVLLGLGINPEEKSPEYRIKPGLKLRAGFTFLEIAAFMEDFLKPSTYRIGEILIKLGANVEAISELSNKSLLQVAIIHGISLCVQLLLENGASLTGPEWEGQSPGFIAISCNDSQRTDEPARINEILRQLFKHGMDPKWRDQKGCNLLHHLIYCFTVYQPAELQDGIMDIAKTLVEAGVPLEDTNYDSVTPLNFAIHRNDPKLADYLIEMGADMKLNSEFSAVELAVRCDSDEVLDLFLNKGIYQINEPYSNGSTLLHVSCLHDKSRIVGLLLRRGADVSAKDYNTGKTPFSLLDLDNEKQKDSITHMLKEFAKASFENNKVCESDWKLISEHQSTFKIFIVCKKELKKMSSTRFYGTYTYLQVLKMTKSVNKLANLTKNDEFVMKFLASLKLFDFYKEDLEIIFKRAVELRDESLEVYRRIETIFYDYMPEVVLRNLSNHLKIKDLPLTE